MTISKALCYLVLAGVAIGIAVSFPDIKRYIQISTM
jgi:uncharacterized protein DUF6893